MEISRSPLASAGRPAGTTWNTGTARAAVVDQAAPAQSRARVHSGEQPGRVLQGELLQRERTHYQSTRAFLDERAFDHARPGDREAAAPRMRAAISLYQNTAGRDYTAGAAGQGGSINFFV